MTRIFRAVAGSLREAATGMADPPWLGLAI